MRYLVNDEPYMGDAVELANEIMVNVADNVFPDYLSEEFGWFDICGQSFGAYEILDKLGEYDDALQEFIAEQADHIVETVNGLDVGDWTEFFGYLIRRED